MMFVSFTTTILVAFARTISPFRAHTDRLALAAGVDFSPLVKAAVAAAGAVITLIVPVIAALLAQWLRSKLKSDEARGLFDRVHRFAETEVRALAQSTVPEVRAALEDGRITPDEAARLRAIVIDKVRTTLGTDAVHVLQTLLGDRDVDSYLASVIESEVLRVKTDSVRGAGIPGVLT